MPLSREQRAKMRMVHILLPKDLHRRVRLRCVYEDKSIQDYVAGVIERDMRRWKEPGTRR